MVIRDIMEELLRIKGTAKKECQTTIGSLDNVGNLINGLTTIKRVIVRKTILDTFSSGHASLECFRNTT
jgi:hypothetical protein